MEWINVNDRLPENNGQYLTKVSATPFNLRGQIVSEFSTLLHPNFSYDRLYADKVTHWMPLPVSCEEVSEIGVELFDNNEDAYAAFAINNHDRLTEENAKLKSDNVELVKALNGVMNIVAVSKGVDGYHDNGDVACWWDFDEIAEVSELIQKTQGTKQ